MSTLQKNILGVPVSNLQYKELIKKLTNINLVPIFKDGKISFNIISFLRDDYIENRTKEKMLYEVINYLSDIDIKNTYIILNKFIEQIWDEHFGKLRTEFYGNNSEVFDASIYFNQYLDFLCNKFNVPTEKFNRNINDQEYLYKTSFHIDAEDNDSKPIHKELYFYKKFEMLSRYVKIHKKNYLFVDILNESADESTLVSLKNLKLEFNKLLEQDDQISYKTVKPNDVVTIFNNTLEFIKNKFSSKDLEAIDSSYDEIASVYLNTARSKNNVDKLDYKFYKNFKNIGAASLIYVDDKPIFIHMFKIYEIAIIFSKINRDINLVSSLFNMFLKDKDLSYIYLCDYRFLYIYNFDKIFTDSDFKKALLTVICLLLKEESKINESFVMNVRLVISKLLIGSKSKGEQFLKFTEKDDNIDTKSFHYLKEFIEGLGVENKLI